MVLKFAVFYSNTEVKSWRVTFYSYFLLNLAHLPIYQRFITEVWNGNVAKNRTDLLEFFEVGAIVELERVIEDSTIIESCNFYRIATNDSLFHLTSLLNLCYSLALNNIIAFSKLFILKCYNRYLFNRIHKLIYGSIYWGYFHFPNKFNRLGKK